MHCNASSHPPHTHTRTHKYTHTHTHTHTYTHTHTHTHQAILLVPEVDQRAAAMAHQVTHLGECVCIYIYVCACVSACVYEFFPFGRRHRGLSVCGCCGKKAVCTLLSVKNRQDWIERSLYVISVIPLFCSTQGRSQDFQRG